MLKPAVLNESSKIPADKKMEKKQKQKPRKITQNNDPFKKKKENETTRYATYNSNYQFA